MSRAGAFSRAPPMMSMPDGILKEKYLKQFRYTNMAATLMFRMLYTLTGIFSTSLVWEPWTFPNRTRHSSSSSPQRRKTQGTRSKSHSDEIPTTVCPDGHRLPPYFNG